MDFWRTILVLFRRWYIALPAFLLAFAAAGAVYVTRPTHYSSYSVLVLTAPISGETQHADPRHVADLTNPLLNFDQGLSNTAAILIHALNTSEVFDQLGVHPSGDATFQVTNGTANPELLINGPFVVITGQSTSPDQAQDLVVQVAQRARQELVSRQQQLKAPTPTYVVVSEVVSPTPPQAQSRGRLRPAVSALAVGFIASIAATFGMESIMTRPGRPPRAQLAAGGRLAEQAVAGSGDTRVARPQRAPAGAVAPLGRDRPR